MAKTVLVTSCKGGIGKSTVAANLSMALAMSGRRVLAVDCDFTMRCLDLIMGLENRVVFNLLDVIEERCSLEKAVLKHERAEGLYFLAAPSKAHAEITGEGFGKLIENIKNFHNGEEKLDYIIIDAPAADSDCVKLAASVADEAIIVCSHMPTAIRAAGLTGEMLSDYGVGEMKLLINSFDAESALNLNRTGIIEMIDSSKLMLMGVVPYDRTLMIHQEKGELIDSFPKKNNAKRAFVNIASRLEGRQIPLFDGFTGNRYKKILQNKGN